MHKCALSCGLGANDYSIAGIMVPNMAVYVFRYYMRIEF